MSFEQIKKRNGSIVAFDKQRIADAILKASLSVDGEIEIERINELTESVVDNLAALHIDATPDVESIQDLIEQELMRAGFFQTARSYIVYREQHKKQRLTEQQEQVAKLEKSGITVIDSKGKTEKFDPKKLEKTILRFTKGLDNVDAIAIMDSVKTNLYDGIAVDELFEAIVMAARGYIERDPDYTKFASRLLLHKLHQDVAGENDEKKIPAAYRKTFLSNLERAVEEKRLQKEILDFDLAELAEYLDLDRDDLFDYMGLQVLYDRYFLRAAGSEDVILETPQAFWMRVAMGMAMHESKKERTEWAKKFYDIMSTHRYVPSTPTLFHSGTTYPQLSSCYLNTVGDDLESIFKLFSDNAQLSKYSGGIGTDYTPIRATGSLIHTTNVSSQGVIPFLKIANDVTVAINRSGKRRGATCAYLETWHMDIEEFLELRKNTGDDRRRTHDMDTANWIPDLFMKRVQTGAMWTLFSPDETSDLHDLYGKKFEQAYEAYEKQADEGKIENFKRIPAVDLWRKMITMLFETGHPWITFKDPCNLRSPQDHVGVVHSSNLCTEITLNTSLEETAVCNLGSVNLSLHVKGEVLDHDKIKETVTLAMRMLDNVIDLNFYPTAEAKASNMKHRPVGLGIMGFQDALYQLDIDFASEAAVEFADVSMELISYYAIIGSSELAKERGAYESFKGSKWDRGIFPVDTLDILEEERGQKIDVARTRRLNWEPVYELVKKHGMRNSNTMAIAPTATISNIVGCYPCIEPIFKNLYVKANMSGDFTVINPYLVKDLKALELWNDDMIKKLKFYDGSVQQISEIPVNIRDKYKEVFEIPADWLIRTAAYRGKWIDQSQSLNIFMRGTNGKMLADAYSYAWRMGLKTTYYLRSLAASQVEKSTVDTAAFGDTHKRDFSSSAPVGNGMSMQMDSSVATQVSAQTMVATSQETLKVCSILDPDCEACQ
ncbi:MAG: ribonucleoside-diphosphate reductase alpha chain [Patescibacteria group bacterium]|nr:ribonucleoside-diphosphate reductase alpha chain [Patescibacteria group bacterium]